jgi:hypothetical protein
MTHVTLHDTFACRSLRMSKKVSFAGRLVVKRSLLQPNVAEEPPNKSSTKVQNKTAGGFTFF